MGRIETRRGFTGNARFAVNRRLGGGSFGEVYECHDRSCSVVVSLQTLRTAWPFDLYCLKQWFRALSDTAHPSLVSFYEWVGEDDRGFLAMERVKGVDFHPCVLGADAPLDFSDRRGCSTRSMAPERRPVAHGDVASSGSGMLWMWPSSVEPLPLYQGRVHDMESR